MNLGTENRNKVIAAVSLVVIAIVLMATRFSGFLGSGSSSASIPPRQRSGTTDQAFRLLRLHARRVATLAPPQKGRMRHNRLIRHCELIF